jgi:SRSO17 transposase
VARGSLRRNQQNIFYVICRELIRFDDWCALAKARRKIEQDYQQLKEELILDHYEGRYWSCWHHHVTLVMLAQAFLTLETLRNKKTSAWSLPRTRREIQYLLFTWTGVCMFCDSSVGGPRNPQ